MLLCTTNDGVCIVLGKVLKRLSNVVRVLATDCFLKMVHVMMAFVCGAPWKDSVQAELHGRPRLLAA